MEVGTRFSTDKLSTFMEVPGYDVTYYILAAQTIHFEVLLLNEASFSQIIRDQWELDAEQSI